MRSSRAQLSHLHTVPGDVVGLARFHGVHDRRGVVAELALADHLHALVEHLHTVECSLT
jgi:hypothetical protein